MNTQGWLNTDAPCDTERVDRVATGLQIRAWSFHQVTADLQDPGKKMTIHFAATRTEMIANRRSGSVPCASGMVFHRAGATKMHVELSCCTPTQHDAQNDITKTYPGIFGKYVPGSRGVPGQAPETEPLERLFYDETLRSANNRKAKSSCAARWGADYPSQRTDGFTNDCDEYPFAATYQGAFTITDSMIRSSAVRPLRSDHNQAVGRRLDLFVAEDHILDGDEYYVTAHP